MLLSEGGDTQIVSAGSASYEGGATGGVYVKNVLTTLADRHWSQSRHLRLLHGGPSAWKAFFEHDHH